MRRVKSPISRDFPTPASPMTVTIRAPRCPTDSANAPLRMSISNSRPMNGESWWAVTAVVAWTPCSRYAGTGSALPLSVSSTRSAST